ncbi:two-component system regulatory protein YycI [Dellaglioa algida]|uniref:two-component system regulatory protein YycI n=1 Tax=Dellaglioa algida TaxID=105612 RepID=UPI000BD61AF2|nr:two-component system regulatory protein YycI [Dellaglioa algida]MDK1717922.1 two-component system regulatory protein YycI [Dellaglioa algida]MDK1729886.1 two-component system regulatory protein YycI [Dellaglioa algida]MDK1742320.1 two-component system regulatory protein YycI [Dellaglioa algida]SOB49073.1 YycH protein [Dellaglioa algida]
MDFKRIEIIFIIVFLGLNIFLFTSLRQNQKIEISSSSSAGTTKTGTTLKEMREDNIKYGSVSNKVGTGVYIANKASDSLKNDTAQLQEQVTTYKDNTLSGVFVTPISILDGVNPNKTIDKTIVDNKKLILHGADYRYNDSLSTDTEVVYSQVVYGKMVYADVGLIKFTIKENKVVGYSQTYMANTEKLRENESIISQQQAILILYQYNQFVSASKVKWSEMGYAELLSLDKKYSVYIPVWIVAIKNPSNGAIQYKQVNAFSGAIMKDSNSILN